MLFLVHQVLAFKFRHFKVGGELNSRGGAGLFTHTAENTAGKIDAEEFRVPAAVVPFGFLQGNTAHWAGYRTEVTGHTALFAVRVAGKHYAAAVARRHIGHLLGVTNGVALAKGVAKHHPQAAKLRKNIF